MQRAPKYLKHVVERHVWFHSCAGTFLEFTLRRGFPTFLQASHGSSNHMANALPEMANPWQTNGSYWELPGDHMATDLPHMAISWQMHGNH